MPMKYITVIGEYTASFIVSKLIAENSSFHFMSLPSHRFEIGYLTHHQRLIDDSLATAHDTMRWEFSSFLRNH